MYLSKHILSVFIGLAALCIISNALASPLVFQGQNAGIFPGANPADTAQMMNSVPKPSTASNALNNTAINTSTLVLESLQSQISSRIYNDIFGTGASPSGNANLGGGNLISWAHDGMGNIIITVTAPNGAQTQLEFPDTGR